MVVLLLGQYHPQLLRELGRSHEVVQIAGGDFLDQLPDATVLVITAGHIAIANSSG